jgi:hypothetical protein
MQFPGPVRAMVGLIANAADEAKHLPDRAIELPMLAVSTALQASLRAQQRYAQLAARGDEVLHRRRTTDDPPPWATFDDPVHDAPARSNGAGGSPAERAQAATELLDDLLADDADDAAGDADDHDAGSGQDAASTGPATRTPPARKAPAKRSSAPKGKSVSKPRHTAPSPFDAADDE